jgi:hypothetical protein
MALAVSVSASLLSCSGAGANLGCPNDTGCGGDPTGSWQMSTACQFVPPLSYSVQVLDPPQTMPQSPNLAPPPPSSKTSGDWCQSLVYGPPDAQSLAAKTALPSGRITQLNLFHAPAPVQFMNVTLSPGVHTYSAALQIESNNETHFAPSCLTAYGQHPSCSDLAEQIILFTKPMANFQNQSCTDAADGGCDCKYQYESSSSDVGTWRTEGNLLYFFSSQSVLQPITTVNYCVSADKTKLAITGFNGQSLFAKSGLRSLYLVAGQPM